MTNKLHLLPIEKVVVRCRWGKSLLYGHDPDKTTFYSICDEESGEYGHGTKIGFALYNKETSLWTGLIFPSYPDNKFVFYNSRYEEWRIVKNSPHKVIRSENEGTFMKLAFVTHKFMVQKN